MWLALLVILGLWATATERQRLGTLGATRVENGGGPVQAPPRSGASGASRGQVESRPEGVDIMLTDITVEDQHRIAADLGVPYLGEAASIQSGNHLEGIIWDPSSHRRLVVSLVTCRRARPDTAIHVVYVVCPASPRTYLCREVMDAIDPNVDRCFVEIEGFVVDANLSPVGSHFETVNVLGMDALEALEASILIDWKTKTFSLRRRMGTQAAASPLYL